MRRIIAKHFQEWQNSPQRKPLIVRGARQVGKSYSIREFGQDKFSSFIEINFERNPEYYSVFKSRQPADILRNLSILTRCNIEPSKTLLFLDEIQACPQAIQCLRYFYEEMPDLHIIAAGSLLDFILESEKINIPVGRIQYLHMYPLSYTEYLLAHEEDRLVEFLNELNLQTPVPEALSHRLWARFAEYITCGGMPAVVKQFVNQPEKLDFQYEQQSLLQTYRDDFGKYASRARHEHLQVVLGKLPHLVGQQIKYTNIDRDSASREIKQALQLLTRAGLATPVYNTSAKEIPLSANRRDQQFKAIFLDTGLVFSQCFHDLIPNPVFSNVGYIVEQFIGQALVANTHPLLDPELYYWKREQRSSQAEVDYLTTINGQVIPIEVKTGATGSLKSLRLLMQESKLNLGVRFANQPLSLHDGILSIPHFAVDQLVRLVEQAS